MTEEQKIAYIMQDIPHLITVHIVIVQPVPGVLMYFGLIPHWAEETDELIDFKVQVKVYNFGPEPKENHIISGKGWVSYQKALNIINNFAF